MSTFEGSSYTKVISFIDAEQLRRDVSYTDTDLDTAMDQQAPLFAYYSELHAKAMKQEADLKLRRDVVEAKVYKELRDKAADEGRKVTEAQLAQEVALDSRVIKAQMNLNEARAIAELSRNALESFKQRRDMLVQRGVALREERKGDLYIKQVEADEARMRARRERALEIAAGR